jgi:hypothetical protein
VVTKLTDSNTGTVALIPGPLEPSAEQNAITYKLVLKVMRLKSFTTIYIYSFIFFCHLQLFIAFCYSFLIVSGRRFFCHEHFSLFTKLYAVYFQESVYFKNHAVSLSITYQ